MHVCFPLPPIERYAPNTGGAISTCVMQIAAGLIRRGHRVTVLADNHGDSPYEVGDFRQVDLPMQRDVSLARRVISKLRYRVAKHDWPRHDMYVEAMRQSLQELTSIDAIVVENDLHTPGMLKRALPNKVQVLWLHNEQHPRYPRPAKLLASADRLIANSDYIRRFSRKRLGLGSRRIDVVHNGVDLTSFTPRNEYDTSDSPVRVLALGRIDPNKGTDLAVDAVAALRDEGIAIELTVVGGLWFYGEGQDNSYMRDLRQKMQAAGATYLGHQRREVIPDIVRRHDIACVLSRSQEPFGLVALEAMAGGCAVVASDRGGLLEACGGAAITVDVDRPERVADALRSLATDPCRLVEAKRAAVARASKAGWDRSAEEFEAVLLDAVGGRGSNVQQPGPSPVSPEPVLAS